MSTYLLRRFSRRFVIPYIRAWVRPNHVTTLRLISGLFTCFLLIHDLDRWAHIAALIWIFSGYCDRLDGELARVCNTTSPGGRAYDYISDMICTVGFFLAAGIGIGTPLYLVLGLIGAISVTGAIVLSEKIELSRGEGGEKAWQSAGIFDLDDSTFLFSLFLWLDAVDYLLIGGAVGGSIFALITFGRWRQTVKTSSR